MNDYDVAIIGSGIAGTSLATILARHGLKVVVFEAKSHPRFAIGESLILETSETMRAMAHFYDVPALAYFSSENYKAAYGTTHGIKRHFGFLHHTKGQPHHIKHTLQAIIPKEPHGHELHLYRQDTDSFLLSTAIKYGAIVRQNTPVERVKFYEDGVAVILKNSQPVTASYLVDAGGFRSVVAQQFNLRQYDLRTHSRALFTHMVNVPDYHKVGGSQKAYGLPYSMAEGTLHHIFDGGWLWAIPFDNHTASTNPLCSVGLLLDPRQYPLPANMSAEEEFFTFIEAYPTIAAQFKQAKAVRDWVRTPGRIQYGAKQVVGDRWALLGHAVGFVDPFYSKGLYASLTAVSILAHLLLQAQNSGDYSATAFAPLETSSLNFGRSADRLLANSYKSFKNFKLWQVYAVLWLLGAYTELVKLNMMRAQLGHDRGAYMAQLYRLKLVGGGFPEFEQIAEQVDVIMEAVNPYDEPDVDKAAAKIKAIFAQVEWMAPPFRDLLAGKTFLPKNKLRLELLKPGKGFLGRGAYRQHFFGEMTMRQLLAFGVKEKVKFAMPALSWQYRNRKKR